jgi:hypothetical protein
MQKIIYATSTFVVTLSIFASMASAGKLDPATSAEMLTVFTTLNIPSTKATPVQPKTWSVKNVTCGSYSIGGATQDYRCSLSPGRKAGSMRLRPANAIEASGVTAETLFTLVTQDGVHTTRAPHAVEGGTRFVNVTILCKQKRGVATCTVTGPRLVPVPLPEADAPQMIVLLQTAGIHHDPHMLDNMRYLVEGVSCTRTGLNDSISLFAGLSTAHQPAAQAQAKNMFDLLHTEEAPTQTNHDGSLEFRDLTIQCDQSTWGRSVPPQCQVSYVMIGL